MQDSEGKTILHIAMNAGSDKILKYINQALTRPLSRKLAMVEDNEGKTAVTTDDHSSMWHADLDMDLNPDLKRDHAHQAGAYSQDFYYLNAPPQVVIIYGSKNRQSTDAQGLRQNDAEMEKYCIEAFFKGREFPCRTVKNPTAEDVFSSISAVVKDGVSGLIVFLMNHGEKGLISVEGSPGYMTISEIITHMSSGTSLKPKVLAGLLYAWYYYIIRFNNSILKSSLFKRKAN